MNVGEVSGFIHRETLFIHIASRVLEVIWSSEQAHLVDALATTGDEGRCSLR